MKWQEFSPIQSQAQAALPEGLELHTFRSAISNSITVRIVEPPSRVYLEKEYDCMLSNMQLLTAMLTDIHEFNNVWNSPLNRELK